MSLMTVSWILSAFSFALFAVSSRWRFTNCNTFNEPKRPSLIHCCSHSRSSFSTYLPISKSVKARVLLMLFIYSHATVIWRYISTKWCQAHQISPHYRVLPPSKLNPLTLLVLNIFFTFCTVLNMFFIFDYLTVILPRRLLSTATARYSTHLLDVDFCRQPHSTPYVDFGRHQHLKS